MSELAPVARVADPVSAAFEAFKSGKDPEAAVYGTPSKTSSMAAPKAQPAVGSALEAPEQEATESESPEPSSEEAAPAEAQAAEGTGLPTEEEIVVSDDSGTRRRLKVSYTDREKIKKAYEMAAGMRKAFSERDTFKQKVSAMETDYKDLKSSWGALEEAFSKSGVAGIVNLLGGKNDAFESFMKSEVDKRNRYATASPEEKRQLDLQSQLDQERAEKKQLMDKVQADLSASQEAKKSAEQKNAESVLHPTFDKYRFTGKLGDASLEEQLDSAVWTQAREKLMALPDDTDITPAMVDKAFRETANTFRKAIDKQANTQVQQTVAKKKVAAQEAAQAAVQGSNGGTSSASQKAVSAHMKNQDFGSLFRDVFSGKIKL